VSCWWNSARSQHLYSGMHLCVGGIWHLSSKTWQFTDKLL